jgi:hypothetical protein
MDNGRPHLPAVRVLRQPMCVRWWLPTTGQAAR